MGFVEQGMGRPQYAEMDTEWLKAELAKPGRSQSALARHLGVVPEIVNRIVHGRRQVKANEADVIRAYLAATESGVPATLTRIAPHASTTAPLPVKGTVEAGSWRESVALSELGYEPETLIAPRSVVDSGAFALRVAGPSMDLLYPDGSYVVVQPWHGGHLPFGKRVIVERSRDGLIETTVKELVRGSNGEPELCPRSSHPAHQKPIAYKEEDVTIRLVGVVIWSMRPD
jgi:SOS-response transcriptional repressor LexA